jgi:O-antigen/teichoic acid export membrane protein
VLWGATSGGGHSMTAVGASSEARPDRRVAISVVGQTAGLVVTSLLGVLIVKLLTAGLGRQDYGVYAAAQGFVLTFALLSDLGVNSVTVRDIARNPDDAAAVIAHNLGLRLSMTVLMVPVIYGLSFLFFPGRGQDLHITILIFSAYLGFDAIRMVTSAWLTSQVRNDLVSLALCVQQLFLLAVVILILRTGSNVELLACGWVTANVVAAAVTVMFVRKQLTLKINMSPARWPGIFRASASVGLLQLANVLYLKIDGVMVSVISGPTATGVYSVSYLVVTSLTTIPVYVMSALVPSISRGSAQELRGIATRSLSLVTMMACFIAAVVVASAPDIVRLTATERFIGASVPLQILISGNILLSMGVVFSFISVILDSHRPLLRVSLIALVMNIGLNCFFIAQWGIVGAAIATVPPGLYTLVMMARIFERQTGHHLSLVAPLWRPLIAGAIAAVVGTVEVSRSVRHLALLGRLPIESAVTACLFVLLLALFRGIPPEGMAIFRKMIGRPGLDLARTAPDREGTYSPRHGTTALARRGQPRRLGRRVISE